jgi:hypothetical protein
MIRARHLNNVHQKRTLRALYAQTQATPYAGVLHPSLRNTDGSFRAPVATDTLPLARSAAAALLQGSLLPGTVMAKSAGESFVVHNGVAGVRAFGLLANFVGGTFDELGDENSIAVWRGPDSLWELLKPAFDDTGLAAAYATASDAAGTEVKLYAQPSGLLGATAPGGATDADVVARLVEYTPSKIIVDLRV